MPRASAPPARALERALPLLKPGQSLRFATLPQGEDPDTLVLQHGEAAMSEVLARAKPLAEALWQLETAQPIDTPERRAALDQRLENRVRSIADRSCRSITAASSASGSSRSLRRPGRRPGRCRRPARRRARAAGLAETPRRGRPRPSRRRQQEVLLAALLNHPSCCTRSPRSWPKLQLRDPRLDKLCHEILRLHALNPDLTVRC